MESTLSPYSFWYQFNLFIDCHFHNAFCQLQSLHCPTERASNLIFCVKYKVVNYGYAATFLEISSAISNEVIWSSEVIRN